MLLTRLNVRGSKMIFEIPRDSWAKFSHNVQDFNESMLPKNVTSDDIVESQKHWKWSGTQGQYFRGWQSTYQSSPFPYKWDFHTRSSIIPSDETMAVNKDRYWSTVPLSSFKPRFHKAKVRWLMSKKLLLVESEIGSNFSGIYREWFEKISSQDERWSFLECLEGVEMNDFWFGYVPWSAATPFDKEIREAFIDGHWSVWYRDLGFLSVREQAGIIEYPDLADRTLEPPESLKRLILSEDLPKDLEITLMQAWPSFRRNWPQTARCTVFSLHDSREALAKIKEWMETSLDTEQLLLEDSGRSSLQEWLVGFVDL